MSLESERQDLHALSQSLSEVHRSLLKFQKEIHEGLDELRLTPYDALHASIHHPDYEWLKPITSLIASIDTAVDDNENSVAEFEKEVVLQLASIFNGQNSHPGFKSRLEAAMFKDPQLCLQVADLRTRLSKAQR